MHILMHLCKMHSLKAFVYRNPILSHFRSTIGAAGFNFSVRNGKRWNPRAMAALISLKKEHYTGSFLLPVRSACGLRLWRLLSLLCLNGFL